MACLSSDVAPGDDNDRYDTILKDLQTSSVKRISLDAANQEVRQHSRFGIPSEDGRYVVFNAEGVFHPDVGWVPPNPDATTNNVFLRDTVAATTELISRSASGIGNPEGVGANMRDAVHAHREVLFSSSANYLETSPEVLPVFVSELFVRNWQTGAIERISARPDGGQSASFASLGALGRDGRHVVFVSDATDLTNDNPLGHNQIFLRDRISRLTTRITRPVAGGEFAAAPYFYPPRISADAEWILFGAALVGGFTNDDSPQWARLYLLQRSTGVVEQISRGSAGELIDNSTFEYDISADGRIVAFFTRASNVLPTPNPATAIYVKDRLTGEIVNVTASLGTSGNYIANVSLSGDGRRLAFSWRNDTSPDPFIRGATLVYTTDLSFAAPPRPAVAVPATNPWLLGPLSGVLILLGVLERRRRATRRLWH